VTLSNEHVVTALVVLGILGVALYRLVLWIMQAQALKYSTREMQLPVRRLAARRVLNVSISGDIRGDCIQGIGGDKTAMARHSHKRG